MNAGPVSGEIREEGAGDADGRRTLSGIAGKKDSSNILLYM